MGSQFDDIPYSKNTSVQQSSGVMLASMVVHASGMKAEISQLNKDKAKIAGRVRRFRTGTQTQQQPTQPEDQPAAAQPVQSEPDVTEQIRKLAELRDEGLLTDEEFAAEKKDLLGP